MNRFLVLEQSIGRKRPRNGRMARAYDTGAPIILRYDDIHAPAERGPGRARASSIAASAFGWEEIAYAQAATPSYTAPSFAAALRSDELVCSDVATTSPARATSLSLDDEAFAADVAAIVDTPVEGSTRTPAPPRAQVVTAPAPAPSPTEAAAVPQIPEDRHAIFDQLAMARTFDAGTLSVDWDTLDRALDAEGRAAARAQERAESVRAEPPAEAAAMDAIDLVSDLATITGGAPAPSPGQAVDVRFEVPHVPPAGISPSVAAAAQLLAWKFKLAPAADQIIASIGGWERYRDAFAAADPLTAAGLTAVLPKRYTVAKLRETLERYGPVVVGSGAERSVVTGIYGDGTPEKTFVEINAPSGRRTETFGELARGTLAIAHLSTPRT